MSDDRDERPARTPTKDLKRRRAAVAPRPAAAERDRVRVADGKRRNGAARAPVSASRLPRSEARHARIIAYFALALCLLAIGALAAGALKVRKVEVVGSGLPATQIVQAAHVTDENIFAVSSDQVISRLAAVPSIQVTRVETSLPDRVVIYAQLRAAVAAWRSPSALYLLDGDGTPVRQVTSTALPIVSGAHPPDADMLVAVEYATRLLPPVPDGTLSGFSIDPGAGLVVAGKSGWTADVGRGGAQQLVSRVATLAALLHAIQQKGQHLSFADLRYRQPYFKVSGS